MRSRDRHTTYRGLAIIVRWVELDRVNGWGPGTHRFTASYLVAAQGAAFGRRQYFHQSVFASYHAAAAFALAEAKRAIDPSLGLDAGAPTRVDHQQLHTQVRAQARIESLWLIV